MKRSKIDLVNEAIATFDFEKAKKAVQLLGDSIERAGDWNVQEVDTEVLKETARDLLWEVMSEEDVANLGTDGLYTLYRDGFKATCLMQFPKKGDAVIKYLELDFVVCASEADVFED